MTNKPQSDMPETRYFSESDCCICGGRGLLCTGDSGSESDGYCPTTEPCDCVDEYIRKPDYLAALAELEAKHREEMLGLLDEVLRKIKEGDWGTPKYICERIKSRIEGERK